MMMRCSKPAPWRWRVKRRESQNSSSCGLGPGSHPFLYRPWLVCVVRRNVAKSERAHNDRYRTASQHRALCNCDYKRDLRQLRFSVAFYETACRARVDWTRGCAFVLVCVSVCAIHCNLRVFGFRDQSVAINPHQHGSTDARFRGQRHRPWSLATA